MSSGLENRRFELIAGDASLDLVNTLDWRFRESGTEELIGSYGELLGFCEQAGVLTTKQARGLRRAVSENAGEKILRAVRELREAAAEFFYSKMEERKTSAATIGRLERVFKEAHQQQRLRRNDGRLWWDWAEGDIALELPLWALALRAEALMTSSQEPRECGNPECRWLFLDTSKNHTRRWCDMKICGNRMKARRFKAQRRAEL